MAHAVAVAEAIRRLDVSATFDDRAAAAVAVGSVDAEQRLTAAATHYLHCITQIG